MDFLLMDCGTTRCCLARQATGPLPSHPIVLALIFAVAKVDAALHHWLVSQAEDSEENVLVRAIAYRRRIAATYNRERLRLDPHLLFFRGEDAFMLALNTEKPISRDQGPSLGQFKLAGLSDITLEHANFTPLASFDGQAPRPGDSVIVTAIDSDRSVQRQA